MLIERAATRKKFAGVGQKVTTTQNGTSASDCLETSLGVKIALIWYVQKR
jgi:Tfp pilus assembly protein PilZ